MKKKFFLGLVIGIVLGGFLAIGVYFLTVGDVAWKQYLEEDLVPAATGAGSALCIIGFGVAPVLKKVLTAISLFNKATDGVMTTAKNGNEAKDSIEGFKKDIYEKLNETKDFVVATTKEQDDRNKRIEQLAINTQEILRIGFGNTEELVTKGYAAEIAKVGAGNEETET
jgi:hypothetical protein